VGIAAVVAVEHDPDEVVDRAAVLHGLAGADELGFTPRVPAFELGDRGLGDHHPGGIDGEIIVADDDAREAIHEDAGAGVRLDIEDDIPARADYVVGPAIVPHDDPAVPRVAPGSDERAAVAGSVARGSPALQAIEPGHVIIW